MVGRGGRAVLGACEAARVGVAVDAVAQLRDAGADVHVLRRVGGGPPIEHRDVALELADARDGEEALRVRLDRVLRARRGQLDEVGVGLALALRVGQDLVEGGRDRGDDERRPAEHEGRVAVELVALAVEGLGERLGEVLRVGRVRAEAGGQVARPAKGGHDGAGDPGLQLCAVLGLHVVVAVGRLGGLERVLVEPPHLDLGPRGQVEGWVLHEEIAAIERRQLEEREAALAGALDHHPVRDDVLP